MQSVRSIFLVLPAILHVASANAFEENDCARLAPVEIRSILEPYKVADDYASARMKALNRAYQEAASQINGLWIESKRESKTELQQDAAYQSFSQLDKSELSGFIRPNSIEETQTKIGNQDAVSISVNVLVCVPKPEFLVRWRQEKVERERKPPITVDPNKLEWFDAKSGEPLIWFWRSKDGTFSFFDNKGFHPKNGERLQPVTAKIREVWQQDEAKRKLAAQEREIKIRKEAAARQDRERQEAVRQAQEQETLKRQEAERQERLSRAPELCDQLAGNPYDPMRPKQSASATFEALKADLTGAIEMCQAAAQGRPGEPRYLYQLARATQVRDPNKALPLLRQLVARRYPAAFDNFGWALLDARTGLNDLSGAIASFRTGADLGDPDAMDSLANLIIQGKAPPRGPDEVLRLLQRASAAGHIGAQARLVKQEEEQAALQQNRLQDEQARQMFMGIVGGVLQGVQRR